jgi:tetratricopeptide (TPR) repeat protein
MWDYLGEERFDIGLGLGNFSYTFYNVNDDKDFGDLMSRYVMRVGSYGYYIIHRKISKNNVELSKIVKEKMKQYKANVSITFENSGNVVDGSLLVNSFKEGLLAVIYVNAKFSENRYDTTIYEFFRFILETSEAKLADIFDSPEYKNKDEGYLNAYIHYYSQLIDEAPNIANYYYKRGEAYYQINKMTEAIIDLSKVLSLDPEYSSASKLIEIIRKEN